MIGTRLIYMLLSLFFLTACQTKTDKQLMVFCAAGLTTAMQELVDSFEVNSLTKVALNIASSGTLARQMEQGVEADVYLAADVKWAEYVAKRGLVDTAFQQKVAANGLVLISSIDSDFSQEDIDSTLKIKRLLTKGRLAMGNPKHVPAGRYATEALRYYNSYDEVKDHLLLCKDVRTALMTVELGEAPLGFVYTTDALISSNVKVLLRVDAAAYPAINYIASLCDAENVAARAFYDYISSAEVENIWLKYGFVK